MSFRSLVLRFSALPFVVMTTGIAFAQTPPAAGAVPYGAGNAAQQADTARRAAPITPRGVPVLPQLKEPLFTMKDKTTLFIKSFRVDGPGLGAEAEVRAILAPYEHRKLTLAEIYAAADKITALYRMRGYLVAKAFVPEQDARNGFLRIKLVAGQYGNVSVQNASLVRTEFLQGIINHALGDPTAGASPLIHKDGLERAMLLISDLPGAGVPRVAIGAGSRPETSDFVFTVPEARRFDGYVLGDNFGPGFTGRDRVSAGLNVNSPLGYGDKISGFGIVSDRTHLVNGRLAYAFPLGYDGLHGEIAGFRTTYVLGGVYNDLQAKGEANGVSGTLTYALRRQRDDSIYLSANFTHKGLDDRAFGASFANRTIELGTASISRDTVGALPFLSLPMTTSTSLAFTAGYVNFLDPTQKATNVAGADTAGNYQKLNFSFSTIIALDEKWSVSGLLRAQKALSRNLDSSEQMSLTGSYGVRSYDEGLTGDSGYLFTPELKYALPDFYGYHHSVGLFTDVGAAWLEHGAYTTTQRTFTPLYDIGAGYYASYEYSPGRFLTAKGMVAHTYGSDDAVSAPKSYDRHTKGLVQVGFTF